MSGADLIALLPMLVLSGGLTIVVLAIAFHRGRRLAAALTATVLALAFAALWPAATVVPRQVTPLLAIDGYALLYQGLILAEGFVVVLLSYGYLGRLQEPAEEFHALLLSALLGALVLVTSSHFASFFLGLETLTIPLLALIAYPHRGPRPLEAGVKYLILAAMSSALLLFGMALVYARTGTMEFSGIAGWLGRTGAAADSVWLSGLALIFSGVAFKLSLVPFHLWAADVYEGAPAPVTGFIAAVSKTAVFALLLRYFLAAGAFGEGSARTMIGVVAIASMLIGNLLALLQNDVKRILAYSSIAHLGYLLVAFVAGGGTAVEAVTYYLAAYGITILAAFGVVASLPPANDGSELAGLEQIRGLGWQRPWLAAIFTLTLLSLAGLPLTMGFFAKIYAATAGIAAGAWALIAALVVGSVIGLFYYLRIIVAMCSTDAWPAAADRASAPPLAMATLATLAALLVWLGVDPGPAVRLIRSTALAMVVHH